MNMNSMDMSSMNMASSTSKMPMSTGSSSMSMATSSAGTAMMGMQSMMMVFFSARDTPLYSLAWTPDTTGQYAGTCIFLIVLAITLRFLLAVRANIRDISAAYIRRHDTDILRKKADDADEIRSRHWRINDALVWAALDTTTAGVGYLLMLAVMTMNLGYFLSVLGGTFAGSFVVGRYASPMSG